jgi:hypothetical protein
MTKPLSAFAQEAHQLMGRGFALTEYALQSGQRYNTVALFETRAEAEADLKSEVERGYLEEGGYEVVELLIFADGSVEDLDGKEVVSNLAWQNTQSANEVKECIKGYYQEEERRRRHGLEAFSDGPVRG